MHKPLFAALGLALTLSAPLAAAQVEEALRVEVTPIKGPLFELQGKGGNVVASVGNDGVLLIDSGYAEYAEAQAAAVAGLAGSPTAPRFLLNTHWHFDHVGGNLYWGERGTVIMAQDNVLKRMSTRQEMKAFGKVVEPSPPAALPVITYADEVIVHFNGDIIRAKFFPHGHTDGDSIVFFTAQNVVHMADHLFVGSFPFVDVGSGGNVFGYIANLRQVLGMINDETLLVPGHGDGLLHKADLERYIEVLSGSAEKVKAALAAGDSVEQIAAQGLGPEYVAYGRGMVDEPGWIATVAASL